MSDNVPLPSSTDSSMDPETLEALKGSIRKWERIVDGTGSNGGTSNCPLCQKFHSIVLGKGNQLSCQGCPVHAATGQHGCSGSPYAEYEEAVEDGACGDEELRDLACDELNFLKSLLPKEGI